MWADQWLIHSFIVQRVAAEPTPGIECWKIFIEWIYNTELCLEWEDKGSVSPPGPVRTRAAGGSVGQQCSSWTGSAQEPGPKTVAGTRSIVSVSPIKESLMCCTRVYGFVCWTNVRRHSVGFPGPQNFILRASCVPHGTSYWHQITKGRPLQSACTTCNFCQNNMQKTTEQNR